MSHRLRFPIALAVLLTLSVCAVALGICFGASTLSPLSIFGFPGGELNRILWDLRLPHVLLSFLIGAALATSGLIMQGIFQNPLAGPYIIGVSSGASLGATIAIVFGLDFWLFNVISSVPFFAFASGLVVTFLVYVLACRGGRASVLTLLLTGIALSMLATAVFSMIMILKQRHLAGVLSWLLGGVRQEGWVPVLTILPYLVVGLGVATVFERDLNLLLLGEETAASLGLEVERTKRVLLSIATLLAAAAVAVSGIIGFVGLVIPHLMRILLGPDHRRLLWTSALGGGVLLVLSDTVARVVMAPQELPVGLVTALVGSPFFLYLLYRYGGRL